MEDKTPIFVMFYTIGGFGLFYASTLYLFGIPLLAGFVDILGVSLMAGGPLIQMGVLTVLNSAKSVIVTRIYQPSQDTNILRRNVSIWYSRTHSEEIEPTTKGEGWYIPRFKTTVYQTDSFYHEKYGAQRYLYLYHNLRFDRRVKGIKGSAMYAGTDVGNGHVSWQTWVEHDSPIVDGWKKVPAYDLVWSDVDYEIDPETEKIFPKVLEQAPVAR